MGTNKLLLDLGGESVLRRAVRVALEARLDPVLVVLGHEADRAAAELEDLPCRLLVNEAHARGMGTSLRAGIAAVPPDRIGALVALADMPLVTAAMLAALVERYRRGAAPLVLSEYGGIVAPPTLFDRALFAELSGFEGDGCGRRVARRHAAQALTVSWPAAALGDLDEPGDYDRLRRDAGER